MLVSLIIVCGGLKMCLGGTEKIHQKTEMGRL